MKKMRKPNRFPLHAETHRAQTVVPVSSADERKAARTEALKRRINRPGAMIVQRSRRWIVNPRLGDIQFREIAGLLEVAIHDKRKPQKIIRDLIAESGFGQGVPPVVNG